MGSGIVSLCSFGEGLKGLAGTSGPGRLLGRGEAVGGLSMGPRLLMLRFWLGNF